LLAEWTFSPRWALTGSAGIAQQLPELRQAAGETRPAYLRPERATHIDAGIEHRWTSSSRWRATVFTRGEEDILREPDLLPRLVAGRIVAPETAWVNALEGTSRGIELLVERESATGLSGWGTYSYGRTCYTDFERQETFWADLDQRHSVTLSGAYRFSRGSVGATFRAGSNFPIPAYLSARDGGVFVGSRRNTLRLPPYARLDLRGDREVAYFGPRMRLFLEMLNVLNRANAGLAGGSVDLQTGEAIGVTDAHFGRRIVGGLLFEF
jgi:outer membrane cobalamin receptor